MKYKILLYILILFSINIFSQKKKTKGEITYKVFLDLDNKTEFINTSNSSKAAKDLVSSTIKNQDTINYKLSFNGFESLFKKEEKMEVGKGKFDLINILVGKGIFYTNRITNKRLNQKESFGEMFIVEMPSKEWKFSQESKYVGNYNCFKATTTKIVNTRKGKIVKNIIAWYTPDIPINFGPKDYSGLPGLIVELYDEDVVFSLAKIEFNTKEEVEIKKPKKGKNITKEAYDKIVEKMFHEYRKNRGINRN